MRERYDASGMFALLLTKVLTKSGEIVAEASEQFLPGGACFLDDWIFPHFDHRSASSWGVQMTGGSYPDILHCFSIARRIVAFAMCAQFHESR
jgi:hypothetical protein